MIIRRPPGFEEQSKQAELASDQKPADPTREPWPKPRRRVTSAELVRNFGQLSDIALVEPVHITRNGRERLVLISEEEYQRLTHGERVVRRTADMPEELLAAIEKSKVHPRHAHLDDELSDWKP